jgi:hypothetical protein
MTIDKRDSSRPFKVLQFASKNERPGALELPRESATGQLLFNLSLVKF